MANLGGNMPEMYITSNAWQVAEQIGVLETLLIPNLTEAMSQSLDGLQTQIVDYMYTNFEFIRQPSTGVLESGFYQTVEPFPTYIVGQLINPVVYAWRRERGFSGMTDSLGRTYIQDPANQDSMYYMANSLADASNQADIKATFILHLQKSLVGMGVI